MAVHVHYMFITCSMVVCKLPGVEERQVYEKYMPVVSPFQLKKKASRV